MPDPYSPTQPQITNTTGAYGLTSQLPGGTPPNTPVAGYVDQYTLAPYGEGGSGSGTVTSVAATDSTIVVSGTPTIAPTIARAAISGDVTIAAMSNTAVVTAIHGTTVPATPTSGQVLTATSGTSATWQTPGVGGTVTSVSNSDGTVVVTGTVTIAPVVSRAAISGDVTIAAASNTATVTAINGTTVPATPTSGQVLTATGSTSATWQTPASGTVSSVSNSDGTLTISPTTGAVVASRAALSGDITVAAASNTATVTKVNGTSVPATPSANQFLVATSGTAATWQVPTASQVTNAADKSSASEQTFTGVVGSAAGFGTEVGSIAALPGGITTPVLTTPFQPSATRDVHIMFAIRSVASTTTSYILQMSPTSGGTYVVVAQFGEGSTGISATVTTSINVFVPKGFFLQWSAVTGGATIISGGMV